MSDTSDNSLYGLISDFISKYAIRLLIVLGTLSYFNALYNGFVWEDTTNIIGNVLNQNYDFIRQFQSDGAYNYGGRYMPLTGIYAIVAYSLFGLHAFFYHLIQIVLHIINSIFLFLFLNEFFKKKLSLFLSAVFLAHPINVESISYMAAFNNPLLFFFGISALMLGMEDKLNYRRITLISILFLASFLTKETGIIFLFVFLLYRLLFHRKHDLKIIISVTSVGLIYLFLRLNAVGFNFQKHQEVPIAVLSFNERLANIPSEIFYYLKTFLYPVNLAVNQRWVVNQSYNSQFLFPLTIEIFMLVILILFGIYLFFRKKRLVLIYLFFILWFVLGIAPYLNIIPLDMTVADRWFYFPMVGLLGIIGTTISSFDIKNEKLKLVSVFIAFIIITLLSFRTLVRNPNFFDTITLFEHDSRVADNADIQNILGIAYQGKSNFNEAMAHHLKSVSYSPYATNLYNVAALYFSLKNYSKAEEYYSRITPLIKSNNFPKNYLIQVYADYAMIEYLQKKQEKALNLAQEMLKIDKKESTMKLYEIILKKLPLNVDQFRPI